MGEHRHWTALFTASLQRTDSVLLRGSSGVQYKTGLHQDESPYAAMGSLTGPAAYNLMLPSETCVRVLCVSARPSKSRKLCNI